MNSANTRNVGLRNDAGAAGEKIWKVDDRQGDGTRRLFRLRVARRAEAAANKAFTRQRMSRILAAGTAAPKFTLHVTPDQLLSLEDLAGRPVVLAFYPADWSPVCGDQMVLYNEILPEFRKYDAEILGISVDGAWCHAAFAKHRHLHFPLLADFEPKGEVSKKYGAYRQGEGTSERALFVIDNKGMIFWSYLSPVAVNPGADGILEALEQLTEQENRHVRVARAGHSG
jgi:peroxiredoxin